MGDRHAFLRRVQALKLDDAVTHLGPVTDRAAVKALHLGADVLALPTFYENEAQPMALIEALCAATPVIVTQYGSIGEMVRGGKEALIRAAPVALRYCRRHRPAVFGGTVVRSFQPGTGPLRGEILCGSRLRKMASHCGRACPSATLAHPSQGCALGHTRRQQCYRLGGPGGFTARAPRPHRRTAAPGHLRRQPRRCCAGLFRLARRQSGPYTSDRQLRTCGTRRSLPADRRLWANRTGSGG